MRPPLFSWLGRLISRVVCTEPRKPYRKHQPHFRPQLEELEAIIAPTVFLGGLFDQTNQVGDSVNLYGMASADNSDLVSVSVANLPPGVTYANSQAGTITEFHISGTITSGANSPYLVTATGTDTVTAQTAIVTFNWTVTTGVGGGGGGMGGGGMGGGGMGGGGMGGGGLGGGGGIGAPPPPDGIYIWAAPTAGAWSVASNWQLSDGSTPSVPPSAANTLLFNGLSQQNSTDDINFGLMPVAKVDIEGYTGTIALAQNLPVMSLIQSSGTIDTTGAVEEVTSSYLMTGGSQVGAGTLNIDSTMNWQGGSLSAGGASSGAGTLNVAANANLTIAASTPVSLGWTINDSGVINWTQGDVSNTDSTINVSANSVFNVSASGTWKDTPNDGLSNVNDAGTMIVSGDGAMGTVAQVSVKAKFNFTGSLTLTSAALSLESGGTFDGNLAIGNDSQLILNNGDFLAAANFAQGNANQGPFVVNARYSIPANRTIAGNNPIVQPNVELNAGGILDGAGDLQVTTRFVWSGGRMDFGGATVLMQMATSTISGAVASGRNIDNYGSLSFADNAVLTLTDCTVRNYGAINLASGSVINANPGNANRGEFLINNPDGMPNVVVTKGGLGTAAISVTFENSGLVHIFKGELKLTEKSTSGAGAFFNVDSDCVLRFGGAATHTFVGQAWIDGSGLVVLDDGTINLGLNEVLSVNPQFLMSEDTGIARIGGSGIFQTHIFEWAGGVLRDGVTVKVNVGDTMAITGSARIRGNASILNQGTINWMSADDLAMRQNGLIVNDGALGEGTFNIRTAARIVDSTPLGDEDNPPNGRIALKNSGSMQTISGGGNQISIILENTGGKLDLNGFSMTLTLDYAPTNGETSLGGGTLIVQGVFNQSDGDTDLDGGTLRATLVYLTSGTFDLGNGSITGNAVVASGASLNGPGFVSGDLTNSGNILAEGSLFVYGDFTQTQSGRLGVNLADSDRLDVFGEVALDGELALYGSLGVGQSSDVVTAGVGLQGGFATIDATAIPNTIRVDYLGLSVTVQDVPQ